MTLMDNNERHAQHVANLIQGARSGDTNVFSGIWHWINGVASGIGHLLGGSIVSNLRAVYAAIKDMVDAYKEMIEAIWRVQYWLEFYVIGRIKQYFDKQFALIRAQEARGIRYVVGLIYVTTQSVLVSAIRAVAHETAARHHAVARAEALAQMRLRAMHGTIEREAESGYRVHRDDRTSIIVRLLDYAVTRNPLLRDLVSAITTGILDLVAVDDPPARLLLSFLIKHVINRLGIDKAAGELIRELAKPLLGDPSPRNLHDVIADISARLAAGEHQWARFMQDGGSQVEQAGRDWRDITGVVGNLAFVAFTAQAVVDPDGWAKEISATVGVAANDIAAGAAELFRKG